MKKKLSAFTLAEVLTTLMVIGVVAALTIPTLSQNIGDLILNRQKKVFETRLEEGLHRMAVQDKLGAKYKNTKAFIKEFKEFFSVASVCDSNNLNKCFSEKITNSDGDEFEVANLKSAKDFNSQNSDASVYGVRFSDGTNMLIAYEPNCRGYASSDIPKDASIGAFAKCFKYIYDVNGAKEENKVGNDMFGTLTPTKASGSFGLPFTIIGNKSFTPGETYEGHTWTCADATIASGDEQGTSSCDYWLGAKRFCEAIGGRLPDGGELAQIAAKTHGTVCTRCDEDYEGQPDYSCDCDGTPGADAPELWAAITNGNNYAILWSSVPYDDYGSYYWNFVEDGSYYENVGRSNLSVSTVCVK